MQHDSTQRPKVTKAPQDSLLVISRTKIKHCLQWNILCIKVMVLHLFPVLSHVLEREHLFSICLRKFEKELFSSRISFDAVDIRRVNHECF